MNLDGKFDDAARAAMHCDELLGRMARSADTSCAFRSFAQSVGMRFAQRLAGLLGTEAPSFSVGEAETMFPSALAELIGNSAGNLILPVGVKGNRLFASFALGPLVGQLERIFGGDGERSEAAAEIGGQAVPGSVLLLVRRMEALLIEALAECLEAEAVDARTKSRMDTDFQALAPFPAHGLVSVMELTFETGGEQPVGVLFACRKSSLDQLLGHWRKDGHNKVEPRRKLTSAMEQIEIGLRARLVEMSVSAGRLAGLAPGDVLPITVSRSVPVFVGNMNIASGSVGEIDDRAALQVESIYFKGGIV